MNESIVGDQFMCPFNLFKIHFVISGKEIIILEWMDASIYTNVIHFYLYEYIYILMTFDVINIPIKIPPGLEILLHFSVSFSYLLQNSYLKDTKFTLLE